MYLRNLSYSKIRIFRSLYTRTTYTLRSVHESFDKLPFYSKMLIIQPGIPESYHPRTIPTVTPSSPCPNALTHRSHAHRVSSRHSTSSRRLSTCNWIVTMRLGPEPPIGRPRSPFAWPFECECEWEWCWRGSRSWSSSGRDLDVIKPVCEGAVSCQTCGAGR